jgi:glycosyltransferase involved in cell wall biosynthesis
MKPIVSVFTLTYNHRPYIARCIEGVLMQKTTFPFEMIIGEDCSTDGTREIVSDYANKYPDIIRMITSDSNVGALANANRSRSACQGEFIALCEGDDYWIDPLKLQKQYEASLKYDALMVAHGSITIVFNQGQLTQVKVGLTLGQSGYLNIEDIILKNQNYETSSIFFRSSLIEMLPDWYEKAPVGDVPLKLISATLGKTYYISEIMSVYQKGTENSWSERKNIKKSKEDYLRRDRYLAAYNVMFKNFDTFSEYKYSGLIRERISNRVIRNLKVSKNLDYLGVTQAVKGIIIFLYFLTGFFPNRVRKFVTSKLIKKVVIKALE